MSAGITRHVGPNEMANVYRASFHQICDPKDWKGPVDCTVPWEAANVFMQAIEFMTGLSPECTRLMHGGQAMARLVCVGYRSGPCGG